MKDQPKFEPSSGNVFADLGVPKPDHEIVKAELVKAICSILTGQGVRQVDAAERLGIAQPKVSVLMRGRTDGFSTEQLLRFLNRLGQTIDIEVRPSKPRRTVGSTRVHFSGATMKVAARRAKARRSVRTAAKKK
jgi:predicted XRE-type DNA-binding protein